MHRTEADFEDYWLHMKHVAKLHGSHGISLTVPDMLPSGTRFQELHHSPNLARPPGTRQECERRRKTDLDPCAQKMGCNASSTFSTC